MTVSDLKGDTLVQLVPKPLPALSLAAQDQDLNVTLDEVPSQGVDGTHSESQEGSMEQDLSNQGRKTQNDFKLNFWFQVVVFFTYR